MQEEGQTAWTLPSPGGQAGSTRPFTRAAAPQSGERSGPDRGTESSGMSQSQPERQGTPHRGPKGSTLSEPSCSHAKAKGRQPEGPQASSIPSRQDTSKPNKA